MTEEQKKKLEQRLWDIANTLRGKMDADEFRDYTRSFGRPIETLAEMLQATTFYATRAGEKLRRHGVLASHLQVFMHTSPFAAGPARSVSGIASMREPTSDTIELVRGASQATRRLWAGGYRYAKAGVILDDLIKTRGCTARADRCR